jgi:hypothetical protein
MPWFINLQMQVEGDLIICSDGTLEQQPISEDLAMLTHSKGFF